MIPPLREFVLAAGSSLPAAMVTKATVVAAFGLIGARLARRSRAALRHVVLAATFGALLLLPVASLLAPPVRIAVPTEAREHAAAPSITTEIDSPLPLEPTGTHPAATPALARSFMPSLSSLLFFAWLSGMALALVPVIAGLAKIRALRRTGLPWSGGQALTDRMTKQVGIRRRVQVLLHEALPGPIASGVLRPAILLPRDAETWEQEDLHRALVHELEHVRRADVVVHSIARAVCAVYGFHPLVWMAWRQLVLEAERSCDDAVIARSEATAYADQLVALARKLLASEKSPLLAMANRSDLAVRVRAVLDARQRRGRAGRLAVALGGAAVALLVLTMSPLRTVSASQSGAVRTATGNPSAVQAGARIPSFDVASIKLDRANDARFMIRFRPGSFIATGATIKQLIRLFYNLNGYQVIGGPSWIRSDRYDIEAKASDSTVEELKRLRPDQRSKTMALMIQSLLADRFQLKVRYETKELPVYALIIAKGGPKFLKAKFEVPADRPNSEPKGWSCPVGMSCPEWHVPMNGLAKLLSELSDVGRPVIDETGLQGSYYIEFQWARNTNPVRPPGGPEDGGSGTGGMTVAETAGPSIFTALQEQLGLKLVPTKGPVEIVVIDHIERPSPN